MMQTNSRITRTFTPFVLQLIGLESLDACIDICTLSHHFSSRNFFFHTVFTPERYCAWEPGMKCLPFHFPSFSILNSMRKVENVARIVPIETGIPIYMNYWLNPGTLRKNVTLVQKSSKTSVELSFFVGCPWGTSRPSLDGLSLHPLRGTGASLPKKNSIRFKIDYP
jgi:hypothetical protein